MSADDFQTKYSSVMESMLKSAVAETTKLFETMVDELKAEICKLKKENEDLKTKNDQSEKGKSQVPVNARTCEPLKGLSDGFEKRDTATQCDLVPVRTMVVEQCEPLRDLSLQNQKEQWLYEDMNYGLQEHDYVSHENADSQMAHIQVKQESVLKEEDDEPMLVCGQVVSDKGSHLASACGTEKKGFHVNQEFSTESISLPHKVEETTVAMELASLEMTSGPQVQNLSSDPEHSPVISFATIKDDLGEESDNNIKISEIGSQAEIGTSPDNSLVIVLQPTGKEQHCQRTGEMSVQSDVTVQQDHSVNHIEKRLAEPAPCEQDIADEALKSSMVKEKSGSERICRKRGRPLKRAKHLQQLEKVLPSASASLEQRMVIQPAIRLEEDNISSVVDTVNTTASVSSKLSPMKSKEISFVSNRDRINSAIATNVQVGSLEKSLKKSSSTNKEKTSESQKLSTETTEAKIQSPAKKDVFTTETNASQTPSNEPSHHCSPVTIQDAMLLVEAMNQSTVENASPSSGPLVGKVQTVNDIPAKSVMPRLPVFVGTLPVTALSTSVLSKGDVKAKAAPKTKDAALNIKAQSQLEGVRPNPQHVVTPVSTTKLPVVLSKTVTQTSTGSHQKRTLDPLSVAPSNLNNTGPPKIIFLQNSTLIMPHTMAALSTTQSSTVVTTVVRNTGLQTSSTVARSFPETSSHSRVPSKTIYVTTGPLLPIVTSTSSVTLRDQQGGSLANSKVKIVTPRQSTFVLTTKQDTATSASSAVTQTNSSTVASQLSSSSQELKDSSNIQTTSHKVVTFPQKTDDTSDNLESPKQTITVPETPNTLSKSCSSSNRPLGQAVPSVCPVKPPMVEQKFSAMVRLTRLPFPVSTEKSVLVSQLILDRTSEPQSTLKDNLTQTKPPERPEILSMTEPSIQLTAFASKDASDPHLQMTKTQFLAQLAVSPRSEAPEKASSNELPDSTVCREKMSDKVSPVARLQSHLKGHMEIRRPEVNTEPCMETETSTAGPETFSLEIEEPNGNVTEPFPLCPKSGTVVVEVDTLNKNTTKPTPIRSDQCEEHVTSINSVSKLNNASSSLNKDTTMPRNKKSTSQSPRRTSTTKVASSPKNTKSTSQSPRRTSATKVASSPKNTKSTSQSPRRTSATKVASSPKNTKSTSQSPRRISTTRENSSPKNTKSTSQSPRRSSTNKEDSNPKNTKFTPQSPRRSSTTREDSSPKNTKSTSQSSRRSSTTREDSSPKNTKSTSQTPRRTSTTRAASSLKNTKSTSMSPRRSSTTGEDSSPKNTKSTSQSPRRTSTIREVSKNAKLIQRASIAGDVASPKLAKSTSVSPKRTNSTRGGSSPKITNTTHVSPRRTNSTRGGSSLQKTKTDSVSPRMSKNTGDSMSGDNRRSSFTKGNANPQNKRKSNSFSPRRFSVTTGGALSKKVKSETASPSMRSLGKRGVSPTRTRESTPAKKQRLHQDSTGSKTNLRILNAKKLAKAAKAKSIAKIKISQQKLHDESNTSQITENQANSQAVKKITCKAVWIPPKMPVTKPPKEETKSQDVEAVYPPNNCVHRIPVKAPPMVSPLQPLLVIGGHLLKNQCGECGRILSSCAALESHVRLHIGRRPFSCTLCGKSFPDSKGLKRHGRVHRNGRIHVCPQCGKGFVYRFGLTKHLQMVHGRLKPFVCQICNKGFYTKRDVEAHIRIHTGEKPFHCNLCDKKFARRVELNVHLRWHNGEKRHWCPYCGKGFLDFNNLKRHKYIHTGEKPHSCPHCSKRFTQSGHLKKHVKNVHKIK